MCSLCLFTGHHKNSLHHLSCKVGSCSKTQTEGVYLRIKKFLPVHGDSHIILYCDCARENGQNCIKMGMPDQVSAWDQACSRKGQNRYFIAIFPRKVLNIESLKNMTSYPKNNPRPLCEWPPSIDVLEMLGF